MKRRHQDEIRFAGDATVIFPKNDLRRALKGRTAVGLPGHPKHLALKDSVDRLEEVLAVIAGFLQKLPEMYNDM
jgi:hypothetical protein